MNKVNKQVSEYLIGKYGSDKFSDVLEAIKQQQKESAKNEMLRVLQSKMGKN